ncbi:gliding motility-associated C-terminal domain-containing protein [Flavobacterium sp. RHBU_24]|uniref:T9SS type B sorting domain-containing protein n=1 Tax=Flavobacterium sp. RHBU_24 TaxID=3391185 RepID=UPI003984EFFC
MNSTHYKLICLAALLLSVAGHAQWQNGLWTGHQADNWYWSFNQGLSFAGGGPQYAEGGQTSVMEGTAVMSDENGQLLFYASNGTVWNKNHVQMLNGDNILSGSQSSTQSGIIVPKPGAPGIYYLFNIALENGLVYSEIDMSLDSGLGAVTANKNIVLADDARVEKITAVYHADKERIWVISHRSASNEFIAYLVDESGIAETPVTSAIGYSYTTATPFEGSYINDGPAGQLKASPDGTRLAAVQDSGDVFGSSIVNAQIEIFDFDNTTGQVSNMRHLQITNAGYGIEFSPNSRYLYVADSNRLFVGALGTTIVKIYQYDLDAGNESAIAASATTIGQYNGRYMCALQLGPDGKIYTMNSTGLNTLVAISNPNNAGLAAGFTTNVLTLTDGDSIGLPTFNQSYFQSGILFDENCGNEVSFSLLRIPDVTLTAWNFGDPASGADNTSNLGYHVFSTPGTYTVTADVTSNNAVQTVTAQVLVTGSGIAFTPPQDVAQCAVTGTTAVFDLTAQQATIMAGLDANIYTIAYYTSATDADTSTNAIANPAAFTSAGQTIYVRITDTASDCHIITQFDVEVTPAPVAVAVPDLQLCGSGGSTAFNLTVQNAALLQNQPGATVAYFISLADADANTNAIANAGNFTNGTNPQTIYARVTSGDCYAVSQFNLTIIPAPVAVAVPDLQLCGSGGSTAFNLTVQNAALLQNQPGATVAYFISLADADANTNAIANAGNFTNGTNLQTIYARVTSGDCYAVSQFNLSVTPAPVAVAVPDLQLCGSGGSTAFDLTVQNAALLQNQPGATVAYFISLADADANTNAIANAGNFTNGTNPQTIYARITSGDCYAVSQFDIKVNEAPLSVVVPDLQLCGSGGSTAFNLTVQNAALLQNQPGATVAYFISLADADANTNAIANTASFANTANPQTIYARITSGDCYAVSEFELNVTPAPVAVAVPDLQLCGSGGSTVFDLTTQNAALLQNQPGATVAYFISLEDADANTNAIANAGSFTNGTNPQTIYTRITSGDCYAVSQFDIKVNEAPLSAISFSIAGCPPFNLNAAVEGVSGDVVLTYYASESNAENAADALADTTQYIFTGEAQTVYVRAESAAGCVSIVPIAITKGDCMIPRGISPNGDTLNDSFDLSFLEVRKLVIYNRYGLEVYSRHNYKNEWYGQADNNNELPTGTYFYVVEPEMGQSTTGWVYINRQTN